MFYQLGRTYNLCFLIFIRNCDKGTVPFLKQHKPLHAWLCSLALQCWEYKKIRNERSIIAWHHDYLESKCILVIIYIPDHHSKYRNSVSNSAHSGSANKTTRCALDTNNNQLCATWSSISTDLPFTRTTDLTSPTGDDWRRVANNELIKAKWTGEIGLILKKFLFYPMAVSSGKIILWWVGND